PRFGVPGRRSAIAEHPPGARRLFSAPAAAAAGFPPAPSPRVLFPPVPAAAHLRGRGGFRSRHCALLPGHAAWTAEIPPALRPPYCVFPNQSVWTAVRRSGVGHLSEP